MTITCPNCQMQYDSQAELAKHQAKFCVNSHYSDIEKLDNRFNILHNEMTEGEPKANFNEIKQFVAGEEPPHAYRANEVLGEGRFIKSIASQQHRQQLQQLGAPPQLASQNAGSLLDQAERLKNERAIQRQLKSDDEKDVLSLLQDLEQKKERELRAAVEKEEIERAIKNSASVAGGNLGYLQQEKSNELKRLAQEREAVRIREQGFLDEISKMETSIIKQEQFFKKQRESVGVEDPNVRNVRLQKVRDQETDLAQQRAAQVASVKVERERLERERQRIMAELERNNASGPQSGSPSKRVGGFRENQMGRRVGSAAGIFDKPPSGYGGRNQGLEPSLKDKLVSDQVRLNQLKNEAKEINNQKMTDVDEIDVLEREMRNNPGPGFEEGLKKLHQDFQQKSPTRTKNLDALQRRLEMEGGQAASPNNFRTPKPPMPSKQFQIQPMNAPQMKGNPNLDNGLMGKLDDLEGLLLGTNQGTGAQNYPPGMNQPPLNVNRVSMRQMPPQPIGPTSGFPPPSQFPQPSNQFGQPQSFQTPGMGYGQRPHQQIDVYPYNQPFQDPAMAQLADMLHKQESENKELRNVMENFAKNTSPYDELEQQMRAHDNQIKDIANGKMPQMNGAAPDTFNGMTAGGEENLNSIFPDEFAFRQNDQRADDLEVEERALMNLAAQEYDSLRVIQRLPKDSDLYEYKLKQYKELSAMRTEVEKVLQEQRLEKIRRDFEKQKLDEDRALRHAQWMEQQKRSIVDGKVTNQPAPYQQQYDQQQTLQQQQNRKQNDIQQDFFEAEQQVGPAKQADFQYQQQPDLNLDMAQAPMAPMQQPIDQDPTQGYIIMIDAVYGEPRQLIQLKCVVRCFQGNKTIGEPAGIGPIGAEIDHTSPNLSLNKVVFNKPMQIPQESLELAKTKLLFELQAPDAGQTSAYSPAGWTYFDLQHLGDPNNIATGKWILPILTGSSNPEDMNSDKGLNSKVRPSAAGIFLTLKMGKPGDDILSNLADHSTQHAEYTVPIYHRSTYDDSIKRSKEVKQAIHVPQGGKFDSSYKNTGLKITLNWISTKTEYQAIALRHDVYIDNGKKVLSHPNQAEGMGYKGSDIYSNKEKTGPGALIMMGQDGQAYIQPSKKQAPGGHFVQNQILTKIKQSPFVYSKEFYKDYWQQNRTKSYHLQFDIFQLVGIDQFQPVGWVTFLMLNEDDGKLKSGYHVLPINSGAVTYDKSKWVQSGDFLGITIQDPTDVSPVQPLAAPPLQQPAPAVNDVGGPVGPQQVAPQMAAQQPQQPQQPNPAQQAPLNDQDLISEQLIQRTKKEWDFSKPSKLDENIDIYLDGSRFMPDNVYVTRVQLRVLDSNQKDLGGTDPIVAMANIEKSTLRNQHYGIKMQLRPKNAKQKWPAMSTVMVIVDTIDQSTEQAVYVGTSMIPLYLVATKGENQGNYVQNEKQQEVVLHEGNFQVVLHHATPTFSEKSAPFNSAKIVHQERVPTASMLLRIVRAKTDPQGVIITEAPGTSEDQAIAAQQREPVPPYKDGKYLTRYINFSQSELDALKMRRRRVNPDLKVLADKLLQQLNKDPKLVDATERAKLLEKMMVDSFKQQDKDYPKHKDMKNNEKLKFIDLNYHSQYEPKLGFRATIEAVHNVYLPKGINGGFFSVLASVCPPASYYDPNRKSKGLKDGFTFTQPDFTGLSTNLSFRFDEGESVLRGFIPTKPGMSILFDVKIYDPAKEKFQDYGFAVSEVLGILDVDNDSTSMEYYVQSGVFSMQLFQNAPPQELIDVLRTTEKPLREVEKMVLEKKIIPYDKTSIIVKIVDSQRELHFGKTIDQATPSVHYIPKIRRDIMTYKQITGGLFGGPKAIKNFLPEIYKKNPNKLPEFNKLLRTKFKEFMGIGQPAPQAAPGVPPQPAAGDPAQQAPAQAAPVQAAPAQVAP